MKISRKNLNILIEKFLREQEEMDSSEPEAESTENEKDNEPEPSEADPDQKEPRTDFEFSTVVTNEEGDPVPIDFKVAYDKKGEPVPTISSDDDRVNKLIAKIKPIDYLSLAFEKMKELKGYEDEERKSMFNKIAFFLKDYDVSIETEDPREIFKVIMKHLSYIKFSLHNIKKLLSK